jgi:putative flippase GtrA
MASLTVSPKRIWESAISLGGRVPTLGRFIVVGSISALIYVATVFACVRGLEWAPMAGHAAGLSLSTTCSYFGHLTVTFQARGRHAVYLPRFIAQTVVTTLLSTAFVALAKAWGVDYRWAVAANVTIVPALNFISMQIWVFSHAMRPAAAATENTPERAE